MSSEAPLGHDGAMARDEGSEGEVEHRFYTLDQVATYLAVSKPQAYALVRSGELPAIKLGGRGVWRVDRGQLEAYIERLHEKTAAWAKAHPLGRGDTDEEPEGADREGL